MQKHARKFIVDASELLEKGTKLQPVKLAIVTSEDAEGYLVIESVRASPFGTVEDLTINLQSYFDAPSTRTT